MIIHLDTSVLIDILTRTHPLLSAYEATAAAGHRITISTVALYEWARGPRTTVELEDRLRFFPDHDIVAFGIVEAQRAGRIYREVGRGRGREFDIAIAASAIEQGAALWTVNPDDFKDIPDLQLYVAPRKRLA